MAWNVEKGETPTLLREISKSAPIKISTVSSLA